MASKARASAARRSTNSEGTGCAVEEPLQRDVVGEIFGAVSLRGDVRADTARVLVKGVARAKRRRAAVLSELAGPVLALPLLDRRAVPVGEGAEVDGIHERGV